MPPTTEIPFAAPALGVAARETESRARWTVARHWLALAVVALALSGFLALWVVAGRIPALAPYWTSADLANRLLVVHVDLGVVVWFGALPVALFHLHALATGAVPPPSRWQTVAPWVAALGGALLLVGLVPGVGEPRPVNYIPVVTHPLYALGLVLFLAGAGASYLERHLVPWRLRGPHGTGAEVGAPDADAEVGAPGPTDRRASAGPLPGHVARTLAACGPLVRVGALYFVVALAALATAFVRLPPWLEGDPRMEVLMWGGGHVLQFTNVAFALVAWALLASWWSGRSLEGKKGVRWTAVVLAIPLPFILLLLAQDPATASYRGGFTTLMRWGLFPSVLVFLATVLVPHARGRPRWRRGIAAPGVAIALAASVVLMLVGFVFGAFIRGADLRIPGHYHACIGSVTLAYMAVTLLIMDRRRARAGSPGVVGWVGLLYGAGQLVFSTGLFIAGSYGLGRKLYGMEQEVLNPGQGVGLAVMAVGGTAALAGGGTWAVAALKGLGPLLGRGAPVPPSG